MFKREYLIKKIQRNVKAFVGMDSTVVTASVLIFKVEYKFFKWCVFTKYEVKRHIPYIDDPFFDGEYATNNNLRTLEKMLMAEAETFIEECKMNTMFDDLFEIGNGNGSKKLDR